MWTRRTVLVAALLQAPMGFAPSASVSPAPPTVAPAVSPAPEAPPARPDERISVLHPAIGGAVHVRALARVPASVLSLGGTVRVEPGAAVSSEVDSFPWVPVPGQREPSPESAASLVAMALVGVLAGAAVVRQRGVAARDAALARSPFGRALIGLAALAALVAATTIAGRLHGRLEGFAQSALALGLVVALVVGSTGVASLVGRATARLAGRRMAPGWRAALVGAAALAILCLVPLLGAAAAVAALVLACGGAVARRGTLAAPPDEVAR
jgi:hypothetical protein